MRSSDGEDPTPLTDEPGARPTADDGQASGNDASALRYSPAQRELLEQGLRILARLAVRAYLRQEASLPATDGEQHPDNPAEDSAAA